MDALRSALTGGGPVGPLHEAAMRGRDDDVRRLIAEGWDVNKRNYFNYTPLHHAAFKGYHSTCLLLLQAGAGPSLSVRDVVSRTPIDDARSRGHRKVVNLLESWQQDDKRGVINIINNFKFIDSRNNFSDATGKADKDHLVEAFTKLNYRINYHENKTKKEIDQIFLDIKQDERLKTTNVILFYMLSHGSDTYTFLSSDEKDIDLHEKMLLFRRDNCPEMAYKPQLWFGDFCRGRDEQKIRKSINKDANAGSSNKIAKATRDVFSYTQYIMSSTPGIMSLADGKGSCFTSTFCEMLNEGKHQLDSSWNLELTNRLKRNGNPTTARYIFDPFPGEMFGSQEFDFCYDTSKINWKVVQNLK